MEDEKTQENVIKESTTANIESSSIQNRPNMFIRYGKFIVLAAILLIAVLAFMFLASIKKSPIGKAPPPDPANVLLATVGSGKIYRNDVKGIALEVYLGSAVTNQVIKSMLDTAVERAILDNEAIQRNIVIPMQKTKKQYYDLLKEKVTEGQVLSITEQDISWWIPPSTYEQRPEFTVQRENQNAMAAEIETRLNNKEDPFQVAKDMIIKYKMFEQTLGYNSAIISKANNTIIPGDRTMQYDSNDATKPFFKMLYSMTSGQVKKGIWADGSGGAVIKVTSVTKGKGQDYNTWLAGKIKNEVIFNTAEINKL